MEEIVKKLEAAISDENWAEAETCILALLKTDENNSSLWYNLGLVRRRAGNNAAAIENFTRALEDAPKHKGALFERAAAYLDLEDFHAALNDFSEFTVAYPDDSDGLLNLARIALHMEVPDLALQAFQKRSEIENDAENILGAAEAMQMRGDEEGISLLRRLFANNPSVRPELLKIMSQGSYGRVPLNSNAFLG
ncbi:Tetratricopeptide repeat protein [Pseudovibrio axinellae]|uniref:Tetratricopeptide repeat protein n=1 Tax=Pseudovibrio axinellae TaxID=989403 RepID=A0A165YIS2_9HYPH|nr:tetratricopeptide repeat protein [Pseudovibrio axinellae]KZL18879.1 Tetratricopeptide repeat protein [Pseudovibrio axinellae]SEP89283.1 Tetratricopeptide repeat-containing protein [Pseudovibrio axinellae]